MENWTQLGVSGLTLGILFFIVRYFVEAMDKKDDVISSQHKDLQELTIRSINATNKFTEAVNVNTNAAKQAADVARQTAEVAKKTSDNLSKLMLKVIKDK